MILLLFPFQGELTYFLRQGEKNSARETGPLPVYTPAGRPDWGLAVCGQGKVEAALAAQILSDRLSPEIFILLGSATALDPGLKLGDIVLADPCVEWDFGGEAVAGRPTFQKVKPLPEAGVTLELPPLRTGAVLSGDRDVFDPAEKAALRERYQALALSWEGAGFHRFLRRNHLTGWEMRLITEEAGEGRPTLPLLRQRMAAGFPRMRKLLEALF